MPRCSAISRPTATRCMSRRPARPAASCSPRSTSIRTSLRRTDLNRPGLPNGDRLWVLGSSDERVPYFPSAARALAAAARDRVAGRRSRTDGRSQTGSGFGVWGHAVNPSRVFPQPRASAFHAKFRPAAAHPDVHASNRPVLTNAPGAPPLSVKPMSFAICRRTGGAVLAVGIALVHTLVGAVTLRSRHFPNANSFVPLRRKRFHC